ncbi:MAG: dihydroorotase [Candidatus Aureabacteria bacterium]|nr:dihydroorotase [Candidatus Auribacterota bacterium]
MLLIKNAEVVSSNRTDTADVWIEGTTIVQVGGSLKTIPVETIDAKGLMLIPGVIDTHVHFRQPGMEWKEDIKSGSSAAAAGGVTTVFDMPNTIPPTVDESSLTAKRKAFSEQSLVNYGIFIGAASSNMDFLNTAENVPGIKVFMGSSTGSLLLSDEKELEKVFACGSRLIAAHAEDEALLLLNKEKYRSANQASFHPLIRSPETALTATVKAVQFSQKYQRRLHLLHLSTQEEVEYLSGIYHKKHITAEVTPHHLVLSSPECYEQLNTFAQTNPPVREKRHSQALWTALKKGVIHTIASDHAPHLVSEKEKGYGLAPSGVPGVETSLPLMLNQVNKGQCSVHEIVKWMCENPALMFRLKNKGFIKKGFDADLVLVDMKKRKKVQNGRLFTKPNWSPYDGWTVQGWPVITFVNGQIAFREGEIMTSTLGKEVVFNKYEFRSQ